MSSNLSIYQIASDGTALAVQPLNDFSSLNDAQQSLPEGVYTTFRTYHTYYAVRLSDHFRRLEESAALLGKPIRLDEDRIRQALDGLVREKKHLESRFRISVDLTGVSGAIYVLIEPLLTPSADDYAKGVAVSTCAMHRENPKAKSTRFLQKAEAAKSIADGGVNEILMVSEDGQVLEGLSSNFFGILEGSVWTAEEGVLFGVTRGIVLDVLGDLQINFIRKPLPALELGRLEEAFITSASRGVLPVVRVNNLLVGSGRPGNLTQIIQTGYEGLIEKLMEPLWAGRTSGD